MKEQFALLSREQAQQVCRNLGRLATSLNITQEAIANKVGLSSPNVSRLFSGRYSPRLDMVLSVLSALSELTGRTITLKDIDIVENKANEE
jgi:predicted transcriptional regulator